MNIGEFTRNEDGTVSGYAAEATYDFDNIFFQKVVSDNPRAPHFNMMTKSPRGRDVRLGSIWQDTAKKTGEVYFRGYFDSSMSGFVRIRLFRSRQDPSVWNVVRKTPQRGASEREAAELPANDDRHPAYADECEAA